MKRTIMAVAVAAALSACGGGGGSSPTPTASQQATAAMQQDANFECQLIGNQISCVSKPALTGSTQTTPTSGTRPNLPPPPQAQTQSQTAIQQAPAEAPAFVPAQLDVPTFGTTSVAVDRAGYSNVNGEVCFGSIEGQTSGITITCGLMPLKPQYKYVIFAPRYQKAPNPDGIAIVDAIAPRACLPEEIGQPVHCSDYSTTLQAPTTPDDPYSGRCTEKYLYAPTPGANIRYVNCGVSNR